MMSGHQPPVGHGVFWEAVLLCSRRRASSPPAASSSAPTAASRGACTRGLAARPTTRTTSGRCPPPQPAGIHHALADKGGMPPTPSDHHPNAHRSAKEPIVPNPILWQIDMGDGTWAVSCRTCRLSYRGPKAGADLLFDTHQCEPLIPLPEQNR
jgi:hypothetical protein